MKRSSVHSRRKRRVAFSRLKWRRTLVEQLESRHLLAADPISDAQRDVLIGESGLSKLQDFFEHVETSSALSERLAFVAQSFNQGGWDLSAVITERFVTPLNEHINGEAGQPNRSSDDIVSFLEDELLVGDVGGIGHDYLDGGVGHDQNLFGGPGDDVIRGGGGDDSAHGGMGIDQVYGDEGRDTLYGDSGTADGVTDGQRLFGGDDVDSLYAWAALSDVGLGLKGDELFGGPGGDFLYGNLRAELLSGEAGPDYISGDWAAGPDYRQNLAAALNSGGGAVVL